MGLVIVQQANKFNMLGWYPICFISCISSKNSCICSSVAPSNREKTISTCHSIFLVKNNEKCYSFIPQFNSTVFFFTLCSRILSASTTFRPFKTVFFINLCFFVCMIHVSCGSSIISSKYLLWLFIFLKLRYIQRISVGIIFNMPLPHRLQIADRLSQ